MKLEGRFEDLFSPPARAELEANLAEYVASRRWFRSKTRSVTAVSIEEVVPLPIAGVEAALTVVRVRYVEGSSEDYVLPLTWVAGASGEQLVRARPHLLVATVTVGDDSQRRWLVDALGEPRALEGLRSLFARGEVVTAPCGTLSFRSLASGVELRSGAPRPVDVEQSNTSVVYGDACILKVVRKVEEGTSPDLEMGEFLTRAGYTHAPRLLVAIELARASGSTATIGMVHEFVANEGDAWTFALATIREASEPAAASNEARAAGAHGRLVDRFVGSLARRIAEMHVALGSPSTDTRFSPEPVERAEREALANAARRSFAAAWAFADDHAATLPRGVLERVGALRGREGDYSAVLTKFVDDRRRFMKTRVHGDLHLGQVLVTGDDVVLIDFEGEPARSLAERKAKRSPLADVAGMLRSLHYASVAASREGWASRESAEAWHRAARREFLRAYFRAAEADSVLPDEHYARSVLLRFYLLEKCIYELHYEINNRPDWVAIPVLGLEQILEDDDAA